MRRERKKEKERKERIKIRSKITETLYLNKQKKELNFIFSNKKKECKKIRKTEKERKKRITGSPPSGGESWN